MEAPFGELRYRVRFQAFSPLSGTNASAEGIPERERERGERRERERERERE